MRINWFKDENNLVYINGATQLAELERTLHFPGLEEAANIFFFMGEMQECYVIYWLDAPVVAE